MPFICYVYGNHGAVPYMEVLNDLALDEAKRHARRLLGDRPDGQAAEIYENNERLARFTRIGIGASTRPVTAVND